MLKLAKLTTTKMVVWVKNGKAMMAKCAKTGKFIKLDNAQFLLDNLAMLATKAVLSGLFCDRVQGGMLFDQLAQDIGKFNFEHNLGQTIRNNSPLLIARLLTSN